MKHQGQTMSETMSMLSFGARSMDLSLSWHASDSLLGLGTRTDLRHASCHLPINLPSHHTVTSHLFQFLYCSRRLAFNILPVEVRGICSTNT